MTEFKMNILGNYAFITKLAGFEHSKFIQPNATKKRVKHDDVPMYIGKNIKNGQLTKKIHWFIPLEISKTLERSSLTKKCIVLPYVGSVGDLAVFDSNERYHLASNVAKIELSKNAPFSIEYLYFYLKSTYGQKQLLFFIQGGIQKNITMDAIRKTKVIVQSNSDNVIKTLTYLNKKIKVNNQINRQLEKMAKMLYDYWFVQFDFPDTKGKPYKSSGGKMVFNKELKREIPEGWEVEELGDILKTELGGTPSTKVREYWKGKIPWLNSGEIANFPIIDSQERVTEEAILNSATSLMPKGSCVLSITRHLRPSILGIDACANQSVVGILESEKLKSSFIYPYLVNEIPRLMTLRSGAQQPHINKKTVDTSLIVNPSIEVLMDYYELVNSIYIQIINNSLQNKQLSEFRDWLLPMLMNGQITVGDDEEELRMVAEEKQTNLI